MQISFLFDLRRRLVAGVPASKHQWRRLLTFPLRFLGRRYLIPGYHAFQQRNNRGIYAISIDAKIGFFAQMYWCLLIFIHCERHELRPYIILSSPYYVRRKGDNWFEYFFDNLPLTEKDRDDIEKGVIKISRIKQFSDLGLYRNVEPRLLHPDMDLESINRLVNKYMKVKLDIQNYVDSFTARYFFGKKILGVHYRGTDKIEAPRVSWEQCAGAIKDYLKANSGIDALFIASDEKQFIEFIQREFKDLEVISHDDTELSSSGEAIHTSASGDKYMKGKEALINCLILSRCDALIKTASFLSAWACVFNPHLPVIMLNQAYAEHQRFLEREIIKKSVEIMAISLWLYVGVGSTIKL